MPAQQHSNGIRTASTDYFVFFRSVFSILCSAFRCAFASAPLAFFAKRGSLEIHRDRTRCVTSNLAIHREEGRP
jgi:hypothetical protein